MRQRAHQLAILVTATCFACQPYYRDDLRRGRAAGAARHLFSAASGARTHGDNRRCARIARRAVAQNPQADGDQYLLLARCEFDAGQHARARATARRALELHPGDSDVARFLVEAYRADGLVASALDFVAPPSVEGAVAAGVTELDDLVTALHQASSDPAGALALYQKWLAEYGIPDHRLIRDARDRLLAAVAADPNVAAMLNELVRRTRAEADADHREAAVLVASQAYRLLPESAYGDDDHGLVAAAASVANPATVAPFACNHAKDGNDALRAQKLGPAIHAYRLAVAAAPWWAVARRNLGLLLRVAGQYDEAERQLAWATRLSAGATGGAR